MTALLSRKQVEELAAQNPMAALERCNEVLNRHHVARDSKRDAWARLAARIQAKMPKTETAIAKPEPVKVAAKPKKASQTVTSKPGKAVKGVWQIDGTEGSRIVPCTLKAVTGLFGGNAVELSDETWRYLARPIAPGRREYLTDPADALYSHYLETGHIPTKASICGKEQWHIRHSGLLAIALDPQEEG